MKQLMVARVRGRSAPFVRRLAPAAFVTLVAIAACAAALPAPELPAAPLTARELAVLDAVVAREAAAVGETTPVVVLTPTNRWTPKREKGVSWDRLRAANDAVYSIPELAPHPRLSFYSGRDFHRERHSIFKQNRLRKSLGGSKPLVLEFSRPAFDEHGDGLVLVHVHSRWRGSARVGASVSVPTEGGGIARVRTVYLFW